MAKLQCNSFKLPKWVLLTFMGELDSHLNKPHAIHFVLLRHHFFNLIRGKQIAFKQALDMTTQNML